MDGILPINKPKGMSSFDVIRRLRSVYPNEKMGHAGSLDPIATGVVLILMGRATRESERLMNGRKIYTVEMALGVATDTGDITGRYLPRAVGNGNDAIDSARIAEVLNHFVGEQLQTIPAFSACKLQGVPRYELARRGVQTDEKRRPIQIDEIRLISYRHPLLRFEVTCHRGVYIRTLCHDIGERLGVGGTLVNLVRNRCSDITLEHAHELEAMVSRPGHELRNNEHLARRRIG